MKTLDDLKIGESSLVESLQGEQVFQDRLMDLGILPGTRVTLVRRASMGGPLEIRLRSYHLAIRRNDAKKILFRMS